MRPAGKSFSFLVLVLSALLFAGCATPRPAADDPAVYRPAHPITYPAPR